MTLGARWSSWSCVACSNLLLLLVMWLQSGAVGGVLSSGTLRALLGPAATSGLGSAAGRSLQEQFDEAVAALRAAQVRCTCLWKPATGYNWDSKGSVGNRSTPPEQ
jgi:hypothetical protein